MTFDVQIITHVYAFLGLKLLQVKEKLYYNYSKLFEVFDQHKLKLADLQNLGSHTGHAFLLVLSNNM